MRTLRPHQDKALQYLFANSGGALFMQMRLGKTLAAIRYVHRRYGFGKARVLVMAPVEGLWAWQRELRMEGVEPVVLTGTAKQRIQKLWTGGISGWFLINYEGVRSIHDKLEVKRWDTVVLDESRSIANPKSKISKIVMKFPRHGESRMVLSGEPAPESPLEYFNQFAFVKGSFINFKSYWQFRHNFFRELAPHEWVPQPNRLERLKVEIQRNGFFMSRKQAGMPDAKVYEVRALEFPPEVRRIYEEILKQFRVTLEGKVVDSTKWIPVQYMWLHQLASGFIGEREIWNGKLKQIVALLGGELRKEQVVIWYKFNAPLKAQHVLLERLGVSHGCITGDEERTKREQNIDSFRRGDLRVLLCQVKCGKTSIDLSNSSTAIYFSNAHSLEERAQSEDRILDPVKRDPLLYLDIITKGTVDEDIVELLRDKKTQAKYFRSALINRIRENVLV
jgi:SNF2 family DNA or RNA helicase